MSYQMKTTPEAQAQYAAKLRLEREARAATLAAKAEARASFRRFMGVVLLASVCVFAGVYGLSV